MKRSNPQLTATMIWNTPGATWAEPTLERRKLGHPKRWGTFAAAVFLGWAAASFCAERSADYNYDPPAPGTYTLPVLRWRNGRRGRLRCEASND